MEPAVVILEDAVDVDGFRELRAQLYALMRASKRSADVDSPPA
jgi:hypothetical protein